MAINRDLDVSAYTDFQGLSRLKNTAGKDPKAAIKTVAQQFETQFINMMLKSMRDATPKDSLFDNKQTKMFRGMMDKEIAQKMAAHGGIGLAKIIEQQLSRETGGAKAETPVRSYPLKPKDKVDHSLAGIEQPRAYKLPERDASMRPLAFKQLSQPHAPAAQQATVVKPSAPNPDQAGLLPGSDQPKYWQSPEAFVAAIMPHARAAARKLGVPAKVLVAQSALETGWGKHVPHDAHGKPSFNFFGIKADRGWQGARQTQTTLEFNGHAMERKQAAFRAYQSPEGSFADLVDFLQSNPRYQQALSVKHDPDAFARALQKAGYATDPQYADKLIAIMHSGRIPDEGAGAG